jgi:hypothetical protein
VKSLTCEIFCFGTKVLNGDNGMRLGFFVTLLLVSATLTKAQSQNFTYMTLSDEQFKSGQRLNTTEEDENRLYCHLENHLSEYSRYIQKSVLPRLRSELNRVTQVQQDQNGRFLKLADTLSAGDLFHVHLRVPVLPIDENRDSLHPLFIDDERYHFQYHSFETFHLFVGQWRQELRQINNESLNEWLNEVDQLEHEKRNRVDPALSGDYGSSPSPQIDPLTESQRMHFARFWFEKRKQRTPVDEDTLDSWSLQRLNHKLRMIDPMDTQGGSYVIMRDRSFISQPHSISILPYGRLNFEGFIQPANLYFAPHSTIPGFAQWAERAQARGLDHLLNPLYIQDILKPNERAPQVLSDHQSLFQSLGDHIRATGDESNIFYTLFSEDNRTQARRHYVFFWDEQYLYSVRYSLHCD